MSGPTNIWVVLCLATEDGGWIVHGVFSTRHKALVWANELPDPVYVSERTLDDPGANGVGIHAITRGDFLAEGITG